MTLFDNSTYLRQYDTRHQFQALLDGSLFRLELGGRNLTKVSPTTARGPYGSIHRIPPEYEVIPVMLPWLVT